MRRLSIPLFILAGIACGLAAVAFHELVELMRRLLISAALRQHGAVRVALAVVVPAIVFALEEVMGNASRGLLGGTIVAAVSAAVVERLLLGGKPLLNAPTGTWTDLRELLGFALAGVVAGAVSGGAVHAVTALRRLLARVAPPLRAAFGGVAIGAIGLFVPV